MRTVSSSNDEKISIITSSGEVDKNEVEKYLQSNISWLDLSSLIQPFRELPWAIPLLVFMLYILFYAMNKIHNKLYSNFTIALFVISILSLVIIIVTSLIYTSVKLRRKSLSSVSEATNELLSYIDKEKNNDCEHCSMANQNNVLNSYNLYTYNQILQIERSIYGENASVFCYSRFRDDGDEVGIPEAEKIVENNLNRGINYYCFYFEENPRSSKMYNTEEDTVEDSSIGVERFIDLSQLLGRDYIEECMDYRAYREARFDVMLYYWNKDHIEGYYGLSFPIETMCDSCDKATRKKCPLYGSFDDTSRILYKKMPQDITNKLYRRLSSYI